MIRSPEPARVKMGTKKMGETLNYRKEIKLWIGGIEKKYLVDVTWWEEYEKGKI
jgi:hypothetical protein